MYTKLHAHLPGQRDRVIHIHVQNDVAVAIKHNLDQSKGCIHFGISLGTAPLLTP